MEEPEAKIRPPNAYFISAHHVKAGELERSAVRRWHDSPAFVRNVRCNNRTLLHRVWLWIDASSGTQPLFAPIDTAVSFTCSSAEHPPCQCFK